MTIIQKEGCVVVSGPMLGPKGGMGDITLVFSSTPSSQTLEFASLYPELWVGEECNPIEVNEEGVVIKGKTWCWMGSEAEILAAIGVL